MLDYKHTFHQVTFNTTFLLTLTLDPQEQSHIHLHALDKELDPSGWTTSTVLGLRPDWSTAPTIQLAVITVHTQKMLVSLVNVSMKTCTIAQSFGIQIYILLYIDPFILKYKKKNSSSQAISSHCSVFWSYWPMEVIWSWGSQKPRRFKKQIWCLQSKMRNSRDGC